jgi:hypothetical protein
MATQEGSVLDFGLLIAYVLPGFVALWGGTYVAAPLRPWLLGDAGGAPTVGGFLFTTVAAVAAGLTVSTVRWLVVDTLHHRTGVRPPDWDFAALGERAAAFGLMVDHYYRYYQFYANALVALGWVLAARRWSVGWARVGAADVGIVALMAVFYLGSRDALRRYYTRGGQLLRAERVGRGPNRKGSGPAPDGVSDPA